MVQNTLVSIPRPIPLTWPPSGLVLYVSSGPHIARPGPRGTVARCFSTPPPSRMPRVFKSAIISENATAKLLKPPLAAAPAPRDYSSPVRGGDTF